MNRLKILLVANISILVATIYVAPPGGPHTVPRPVISSTLTTTRKPIVRTTFTRTVTLQPPEQVLRFSAG